MGFDNWEECRWNTEAAAVQGQKELLLIVFERLTPLLIPPTDPQLMGESPNLFCFHLHFFENQYCQNEKGGAGWGGGCDTFLPGFPSVVIF